MASVPGPGPSLRSQWLGDKIRDLRKSRKMSLKEVGEYLQRDQGTISRYENGELPVRRGDLVVMLDLFGVSDEKVREDLEQLRAECWRKDWWDQHKDDFGSNFLNVPWLESRADKICTYQHFLVYGLFQTRRYAAAVISRLEAQKASPGQIQRWVDLRIERQRILSADNPPVIDAVFEAAVLERTVGTAEVMREQLRRLLELGEADTVTIRLIPTAVGPHSGVSGSFNLFEMPEPYPAVAYVETTAGSLYAEEPKASNFEAVWQDLDRSALSAARSIDLIAKRLKEIE
ncbi:helix-turn-helix domain-containing protein [Glycomyces terrestris]|uniref:XRE family transcriptional regulator n=1 Tax=Glycomyces terrestris TaxID=2493553 RepID=A0A426V1H7_9ACTN|nr:helix-turn-helix transcriptional regulator [Glycomyces terrestris]RRS00722.1 XRE family transcriptional regulator [Glycomyces terrestris]